jgi:integrase/recombinase XerD
LRRRAPAGPASGPRPQDRLPGAERRRRDLSAKRKHTLAERILGEHDVLRLIALERNTRNRVLLRLLYLGGLRISEVSFLRVRDLQARDDAGQVTVFGKGGKTRAVLLKPSMWKELLLFRGHDADAPVFRSRKGGGPLDAVQVHRIVKAAAARAGLSSAVSAHWLRHAHVSHALDRGAPGHLVNRRSRQAADHQPIRPRQTHRQQLEVSAGVDH